MPRMTKNDVSANQVKLDLGATKRTLSVAIGRLVRDIMAETVKFDPQDRGSHLEISAARHILAAAKSLQVATETAHTVYCAETRGEVEIVNRSHVVLYRTPDGMPLCPVCGGELRIDITETYGKAVFSVDEDGYLDTHLASSTPTNTQIVRYRCKDRGALHLWLEDLDQRVIKWITVKSQEIFKEQLGD